LGLRATQQDAECRIKAESLSSKYLEDGIKYIEWKSSITRSDFLRLECSNMYDVEYNWCLYVERRQLKGAQSEPEVEHFHAAAETNPKGRHFRFEREEYEQKTGKLWPITDENQEFFEENSEAARRLPYSRAGCVCHYDSGIQE
jgi:hypothetical protein